MTWHLQGGNLKMRSWCPTSSPPLTTLTSIWWFLLLPLRSNPSWSMSYTPSLSVLSRGWSCIVGDLSLGQHGHPPRMAQEAPINPMVVVVTTTSGVTRREDVVVDTLKAVHPSASSANSVARRRTPSFDALDVSMRPSLALHRKA